MKQIVEGIVIKSVDYNANDRIITILTRDDSFVVFKVKGASKLSSPLSKFTIPFSVSEFELEFKSETSHKLLVGATKIYTPKFISDNIKAISVSSYISESLSYFEDKKGLYDYIVTLINELDKGREVYVFLSYIYFLIKNNGLGLCVDHCEMCGSKKNIVDVDYNVGGFLCGTCSINRKSNDYISLLYKISHSPSLVVADFDDGIVYENVVQVMGNQMVCSICIFDEVATGLCVKFECRLTCYMT